MNLIIDAALCEPPSEVTPFRDVTLYGKSFVFEDILLKCDTGTRSLYRRWLKRHGAHDIITQLIRRDEREHGFRLAVRRGNLTVDRINAFNLNFILSAFNRLRVN